MARQGAINLRRSQKPIVIASRRSRLATVQAQRVGKALAKLHPRLTIEYRWIESEGDRRTESLARIGGKGLFTRGIEKALLAEEADIAVHSLKDLPARDTSGLTLAAIPKRADVRDCLVAREPVASIDRLPQGAIVGSSSPRRAAQLLACRPDLRIEPIRGNVETRLAKVLDHTDASDYHATLMAHAGLARLGLHEHTTIALELDAMLPASCQGALAIQCRSDDHVTLTRCLPLNNPTSATATHAERQIVAGLGASCHSALAVLVEPLTVVRKNDPAYRVRARVLSHDGRQQIEADNVTPAKELRRLVKHTVRELNRRGARALLAEAPAWQESHALT